MKVQADPSIGLAGDGDEIAAVRAVEAAFGVTLDAADAPNWRSAGDVYRALQRALPGEARDSRVNGSVLPRH